MNMHILPDDSTVAIEAAALIYAARGWSIFPVHPKEKRPKIIGWQRLSTTDPEVIKGWWEKWPRARIGLDCEKSGIAVVDIDDRDGKDGPGNLKALEAEHGALPETLMQATPSGGRHYLFKGVVKTVNGKLGAGIDTKGTGGLILLAPSPGGDKGAYRFLNDHPLADLPQWICNLAGASARRGDKVIKDPIPFDVFKRMLDDTPLIGGPAAHDGLPAMNDRHSYDGWLNFSMCVHDAAGGEEGEYLEAWLEWCAKDEEYGDSCRDNNEYKWQSFNVEEGGLTVAAWLKLLSHLGKHYAAELAEAEGEQAFRDDPPEPQTEAEKAEEEETRRLNSRPNVKVVPSRMNEALVQVQEILAREFKKLGAKVRDPLFQRDGHLVRLSRNLLDPDVALKDYERAALLIMRIETTESPWLARRLERSMVFLGATRGNPAKKSKEGKKLVAKDAPAPLVTSLIKAGTWTVPTLHATIEAPTLRPDGTILDRPGYDEATGIYYDPGDVKFPKIKDNPTPAEGKAAMAMVADLLSDFPFGDREGYEGVSLAVALAMLMTGPVRRTLPTAPGFAIDADDAEAGKTTLAKAAGALMTGRDIAVKPFADNEEERRKALGTALSAGTPCLLFDNVTGTIEGATLDAILTSANFEDRRLGAHEQLHAPTCMLLIFTGNKILIGGDTTTRILLIRLAPDKPLAERPPFKHRNLIDHIIAHRPELIAAILTALRAYIVHGRSKTVAEMKRNRFTEWSDLIAGCLLYYGFEDPRRGGDAPREADPVKEAMREVIRAWRQEFRLRQVTAADLAAEPLVREAAAGMLGVRVVEVTPHRLTYAVEKLIGVRLGLDWGPMRIPTPKTRSARFQMSWIGPDIDPAA